MTPADLVREGEAIAKRCFVLSTHGSGPTVGYWGGSRSDVPDRFPPEVTKFTHRRHLVSVGEPLLSLIGVVDLASVSLYEWFDQEEDSHLEIERGRPGQWEAIHFSGEPLTAAERSSFPPFEALCLHGSERVAEWLRSLGLKRYEYWKAPRDLVREYELHYAECARSLGDKTDVIVGGWHDMWPEDDYYMPAELCYVLKTLRDAEPWYTVWHSPMSRSCFARTHVS